jgi:exodeoxyribonuclease VIII
MFEIMLDLETMGTGPNAAIVAIGAAAFCPHERRVLGESFYMPVALASAVQGGGVMDVGTVQWWLQQGPEARALFGKEAEAMHINEALINFSIWAANVAGTDPKKVKVWGNGADFDNVILSSAYKRAGMIQPWGTFSNRCYRTIKSLYPEVTMERSGTHHHARDDAISQAEHLCRILGAIGK